MGTGCRSVLLTVLAASLAAGTAFAADGEERAGSLRTAIASDRERLKSLVSEPASEAPASAGVELREIAHRLPALQRELSALSAAEVDAEPAPASE